MTPDEHLDAIVRRCHALLALAEKRTPGEWEARYNHQSVFGGVYQVMQKDGVYYHSINACAPAPGEDSAFIAACAGDAERGWRATIAAIEGLRAVANYGGLENLQRQLAEEDLATIRAAWPIETL